MTDRSVLIPADTSGFDAARTQELLQAMWQRWVPTTITNRVRKATYRPTIDAHLRTAASDERLAVTGEGLRFSFEDAGELEAAACLHWIEVAFAILPHNHPHGWRHFLQGFGIVAAPIDPEALLSTPSPLPMVEVKRAAYGVRTDPLRLVAARHHDPLPLSSLRPTDRAKIEAVAETGLCQCQLCAYFRPRAAKWMAKRR